LLDVPGIGPTVVKKLADTTGGDEAITNTYQLFGKYLMLKGPDSDDHKVETVEHLEKFWKYLNILRGIPPNNIHSIVRAVAERAATMFSGIYDANMYDIGDDDDDDAIMHESVSNDNNDDDDPGDGSVVSFETEEFLGLHNDLCEVCNGAGKLICCSRCNLVFHLKCIRPARTRLPPDHWICAYCVSEGIGGNVKKAGTRRRAAVAAREMTRLKNAVNTPGTSNSEDADGKPKTREKKRRGSKMQPPKTAGETAQEDNVEDCKLKAKRQKVDNNCSTAKEDVEGIKGRPRRPRRQPMLYDPQACAASQWQSDGVTTWKTPCDSEDTDGKSKISSSSSSSSLSSSSSPVYLSNPNTSNNVTAAASNEESVELGNESADTSNGASAETNKEETVEKMDATESRKMAEPSYEDLELLMAKMVHGVDLQTTSFKAFFALLSKELGGIDLTSKKDFIKSTLSDIIISMEGNGDHVNSDNNEEGDLSSSSSSSSQSSSSSSSSSSW
jgi:hypothetical protein